MPTTKKHTENDILNFIQQQILHKNNKISCPPLFFLDLTKASTRAAAALQVVIPSNTTLRQLRNICQQVLCHSKRECSFISVAMEGSTGNSLSCKKTSDHNDVNKSTADIATSSVFVNHAKQKKMDWRSKSKVQKNAKGSNNQEMVDFLVDIWQDDGLYD
ncbi:uncharacterized protein LOC131318671 isoform X3 [Rhododendron vialii]|uniref:uncharacterized protein LOC131318671 isoform X3 n=1 Tax=Rhododendron vialii TaxID=182163 RepID=UPI00265DC24B|nr:uncharacterized protein LOC131318671 isoform X3 [Rhododendron vialii]